ncbi:nuclear transport factor 2 family protein [Shewanella sp. 1CM18E]|uniref:nuclear transport factor 2 family protein n=1 Tax=Shewanella sp. 1CM18E TaxID=2929169 RepID=UPI0020C0A3C1|nr:nuclear transport factor 2 family protein [Shewanella sp. 1CM18E]MCK8046612.1 nuclear transport factor 2 family protein [Shewanella sp. 1CM18E]
MKPQIWLFALSAACFSFTTLANSSAESAVATKPVAANEPEPVKVVRQFIQAFNNHSVEQLLKHTTPNIHWSNVSTMKMDIQTSSQNELGAAMTDYFASLNNAKATLRRVTVTGNYVSTVEEVQWSHEGEQSSQCSLGVYQLNGDKINAVWYYPAHACGEQVWQDVAKPEIVQPEIGLLKETRQ